ncbi:MAG: SpoIIE family protein phosphatase [Luteitalea sp.]|nr:SpoIIE family protein phosphatase [Luteitalea sp.]
MTGLQLTGILIGATILTLGSASVFTATLWLWRGATTLLTFGLFCALYGVRLLVGEDPVRAALGMTEVHESWVSAVVTYALNVPFTLFLQSVIGRGWRDSIRWAVLIMTAFAVGAIVTELVWQQPFAATRLNSALILIALALAIGNVWYAYRIRGVRTLLTDPIVLAGGAIFIIFIVNQNLGQVVVPGTNVEYIGWLVFVVCIGYVVARSVFREQAELASVQRELETARRIQLSLLPRQLPTLAGVDVAARYVPAAAVAGDIYDVVTIGESRLGVLVADVSGHGIPAALVASMVKLAFSVHADRADDPAQVLTSMNHVLCRHLEHSYVTAVYAVVDMERRAVTIANAGHPPALLHRRGAATVDVQAEHGLMLGLFPDAQYTNASVDHFAAGDRLLLYSDGVSEARDRAGQFFDGERVAQWLPRIEHTDAEQFAAAALGELTQWTGGAGRFDDDVTFVFMEAR